VAKKDRSAAEKIINIVGKANYRIFICFSKTDADWQKEEVISVLEKAIANEVKVIVLADERIDPILNPVYQHLRLKTSSPLLKIYNTQTEPICSFVLVDEKDFVLMTSKDSIASIFLAKEILDNGLLRLGDHVSGPYLLNKFMETARRSKLVR